MGRRGVTGFNYLRDGAPEAFEYLRPSRIPEALRTPLAALLTAFVVVGLWWAVEQLLLSQAQRELATQSWRLAASKAELTELKLRKLHLEDLTALDARLRRIRLSGATVAKSLAEVANHIPRTAWLTSIAQVSGGLEIDGRAQGLDALSATVADLTSNANGAAPDLVRATKEERDRSQAIIAFTVRVGARQ